MIVHIPGNDVGDDCSFREFKRGMVIGDRIVVGDSGELHRCARLKNDASVYKCQCVGSNLIYPRYKDGYPPEFRAMAHDLMGKSVAKVLLKEIMVFNAQMQPAPTTPWTVNSYVCIVVTAFRGHGFVTTRRGPMASPAWMFRSHPEKIVEDMSVISIGGEPRLAKPLRFVPGAFAPMRIYAEGMVMLPALGGD